MVPLQLRDFAAALAPAILGRRRYLVRHDTPRMSQPARSRFRGQVSQSLAFDTCTIDVSFGAMTMHARLAGVVPREASALCVGPADDLRHGLVVHSQSGRC